MVDEWIAEVKKGSDFRELGMILIHNGVVRATSKEGDKICKKITQKAEKKRKKLCYK